LCCCKVCVAPTSPAFAFASCSEGPGKFKPLNQLIAQIPPVFAGDFAKERGIVCFSFCAWLMRLLCMG
jgi:hypothetical protein